MWGWDQVMASASIYQNFDLNRTKYPTFIYKYVCMYLMCLCSETNIWFLPCHSRAQTQTHRYDRDKGENKDDEDTDWQK